MRPKLTIEEMQERALERGGWCLSKIYINARDKLWWQCGDGHVWSTAPTTIQSGAWCPYCAGVGKLTFEEMQEMAESRGGKCLSIRYVNKDTKLRWQCSEGHVWSASPGSVKGTKNKKGTWCLSCGGKKIGTIEDMQELAESRGGECLSTEYVNEITKMTWKCEGGHIWKTSPHTVKRGHWCNICSRSITERICRKYFELIFNKEFPKRKPEWLVNKKGNRLELDGFCEELRLAFEYQGEYHFNQFYHSQNLKLAQETDALKLKLCKKNNIILIVISYNIKNEDKQKYIIEECKKEGVKIPQKIFFIDYKLLNIYPSKKINKMQKIALERGGWCLSSVYINSKTKLWWQCGEGHIWFAAPDHIKTSTWCPICNGGSCNLKDHYLKELQEIAKIRGGECLSTEYLNGAMKLEWRCKEEHKWMAVPYAVKNGSWCPDCGGTKVGTIEDMQKIAQSRSGRCLSSEYVNRHKKLKWQCRKEHIWSAAPMDIKGTKNRKGTWCPYCAGRTK